MYRIMKACSWRLQALHRHLLRSYVIPWSFLGEVWLHLSFWRLHFKYIIRDVLSLCLCFDRIVYLCDTCYLYVPCPVQSWDNHPASVWNKWKWNEPHSTQLRRLPSKALDSHFTRVKAEFSSLRDPSPALTAHFSTFSFAFSFSPPFWRESYAPSTTWARHEMIWARPQMTWATLRMIWASCRTVWATAKKSSRRAGFPENERYNWWCVTLRILSKAWPIGCQMTFAHEIVQ